MKTLNKLTTKWLQSAVIIIAALALFACGGSPLSSKSSSPYEPWPDLSHHFDLEKVNHTDAGCHFNTYELCQGKIPYVSNLVSDSEYNATVLGTNVVLRSQPAVSRHTKIGSVNTGDVLSAKGAATFINGKYWNYVYVSSGRSAGRSGYICSDYIIEQEKYRMVNQYVLNSNSNMNIKTESKYLNAIGDILLKLNVNRTNPNLFVQLCNTAVWGQHVVATFKIEDMNIQGKNRALLAFVQFTQGTNDYVVLGIVPGSHAFSVSPNGNGSYSIHFANN